jgi:hypothetical protein
MHVFLVSTRSVMIIMYLASQEFRVTPERFEIDNVN